MSEHRSIFEEVGGDKTALRANNPTPQSNQLGARPSGGIIAWLWGLIALIVVMIIIGGLTRLTDSGLSITEWDPVMGMIPPLGLADWQAAFAAYQETAEFQNQNSYMTMGDFKTIFWWEWGHRQLGRFIGLVWAVGFFGFWATGKIPTSRKMALFWIGPFIGLQGLLGWIMVDSGLDGVRVDVAPYWLGAHLIAAFALLGYIFWQAFILRRTGAELLEGRRNREDRLFRISTGLMHFVLLQIFLGGLVAGIDAGRNYTDWPLMAGGVFPPDMFEYSPWWVNFYENSGLVQFVHRVSAYLLFAFGIVVGLRAAKSPNKSTRRAFAHVGMVLILQMVWGVATVMHGSPIYLAITHQFLAIILWLLVMRGRFAAGYPLGNSVRDA